MNYKTKQVLQVILIPQYAILASKDMSKLTFVSPSLPQIDLQPKNVIPTLVLCQNHMLNITHAIFTYKRILNWENMQVNTYYIID